MDRKQQTDRPTLSFGATDPLIVRVMPDRVAWLVRLRWLAAAGMFLLPSLARWGLGIGVATGPIFALGALVASYNAVLWLYLRMLRRRDRHRLSLRFLTNAQIALDLLVLTFVLHFSGGVTNPLGMFMVFHMAIASVLLPRRDAYAQAGWAALLYASLALIELVRPEWHWPMGGYLPAGAGGLHRHGLFLLGECSVLAVTLILIVYFTSDISSQLRKTYGQLAEANEELERVERNKSRFLNVASHQLRAPLAAVYSMLDAVRASDEGLGAQQREYLDRIQRRAGSMMELLNEMMRLSELKAEAPGMRRREPVDICQALHAVVSLHEAAAEEKKVQLTLECEGSARVLAWRNAVQDVLDNLVSNAVKYTPEGGQVRVHCGERRGWVVVMVSDSGIGIPVADQSALFTEFFRADNARLAADGTGLGLNIVRETVLGLGGRIEICSAEGQGTTIRVELPLA